MESDFRQAGVHHVLRTVGNDLGQRGHFSKFPFH